LSWSLESVVQLMLWHKCTRGHIASEWPVIRPGSMPSAEITSYKPTWQSISIKLLDILRPF